MAVYFLTGTLGAGKGITAVSQIKSFMERGRRVVTNMDLNLEYLSKRDDKRRLVTRIPDKPTIEDLDAIGLGYEGEGYSEKKFGILVLDELGTWFNSRSWNEKGRREIIDWFIHARKKRWHVYLMVQNIDMVDTQLRNGIGQYEVECRNFLDYKIPVINYLLKLCFKLILKTDRIQMSVVKFQGMVVDRWWDFAPSLLYPAYDTQQEFVPSDWISAKGMHSMLTPWHLKGRYFVPKTFRQIIEASSYKITLSSAAVAIVSLFVSAAALAIKHGDLEASIPLSSAQTVTDRPAMVHQEPQITACEGIEGVRISGTIEGLKTTRYIYNARNLSQVAFMKANYQVIPYGACKVEVRGRNDECLSVITCEQLPEEESSQSTSILAGFLPGSVDALTDPAE